MVRASVGGYSDVDHEVIDETAQFDIADHRTLDEVVYWLMTQDHIPSFAQHVIVVGAPVIDL